MKIIDKEISKREFLKILDICGFQRKEYTDFIGKSKGYIHNCIFANTYMTPLRYVDSLIELVGPENYTLALNKIRKNKN